jgi:hypothetical protein
VLFILLTTTVQGEKNGLLPEEAETAAGTRKWIDSSCPPPSLKQPGCEEATERLDIRQLMQQSQQEGRDIVFGGTDYGLVTMATTVRMPLELFEQKLSSYNRYAILANLGTDDPMLTDNHIQVSATPDNAENADQKAASTKSYFRVTAQEINQRTLNRKHERKRNRRKKRSPEVKAAEEVLAFTSMDGALTMDDVFQRHTVHQNQRQTLTNFYYGNRMKKESKTNILFNNRIQDQMASAERRFVSGRAKADAIAPITTIMCIGIAGTCEGSRLKGHARRGGKQFRKRHRRYVSIGMTNEYLTSQTCSTCFNPIMHPQVRKIVSGKWKSVKSNGTSLCVNPLCPTYKAGRNTSNRDVQAAHCIAIAGASRLLTGQTLACFEQTRCYDTGHHQLLHHDPPVPGMLAFKTFIP